MLELRLDILPSAQRQLWDELAATPESFALYGGTAIALRLGHRVSVDFDFFSTTPFVPASLREGIPYLRNGQTLQEAPNTLTVSVGRNEPVKVSFFGGLSLGQVEAHDIAPGPAIKLASLLDVAGMKAMVVTQRAEAKDYIDLHALVTQAQIPLAAILAAAGIIYGGEFSPMITLKAISFHDDLSLVDVPHSMRRDLIAAVRSVNCDRLPVLTALRTRGRQG